MNWDVFCHYSLELSLHWLIIIMLSDHVVNNRLNLDNDYFGIITCR